MLKYHVLQTSLEPVEPRSVQRAFARVKFLTRQDAFIVVRDAFGVLLKDLSFVDAEAVQEALSAEGVDTEIIAADSLPILPPTHLSRRVELLEQGICIHDVIGRETLVEWDRIELLAAGAVPVRVERMVAPPTGAGVFDSDFLVDSHSPWGGVLGTGLGAGPSSTRAEDVERNTVDIVLAGGSERHTLLAEEALLTHALKRPCRGQVRPAFLDFVWRVSSAVPNAWLNRGAVLARNFGALLAYPSRNAYHEEIQWGLRHSTKAGGGS